MGHIFISYSQVDTDFAEILLIKLGENGFTPWIDHKGVQAGDDWHQAIDDAIRVAKAILLILSPDSAQSPYVTYEWAFAYAIGVPLIPLLYRKADLHPKLETIQYLDFTHRLNRPWDKLISQLKTL